MPLALNVAVQTVHVCQLNHVLRSVLPNATENPVFEKVWDDGAKIFFVISVHHQEKTLLQLIIIMISLRKEN